MITDSHQSIIFSLSASASIAKTLVTICQKHHVIDARGWSYQCHDKPAFHNYYRNIGVMKIIIAIILHLWSGAPITDATITVTRRCPWKIFFINKLLTIIHIKMPLKRKSSPKRPLTIRQFFTWKCSCKDDLHKKCPLTGTLLNYIKHLKLYQNGPPTDKLKHT